MISGLNLTNRSNFNHWSMVIKLCAAFELESSWWQKKTHQLEEIGLFDSVDTKKISELNLAI